MKESIEKLSNLLTLIPYFKEYGSIGADKLAKRLGVPREEVGRALSEMMMCGVPPYRPHDYILAVEEEGTVTVDFCDYFRRPLRFTAAEAMAVVGAVEGLPSATSPEQKDALNSLKEKLRGLSGPGLRGKGQRVTLRAAPSAIGSKILAIEEAIAAKTVLKITYYNFTREEMTERRVHPIEIKERADYWYLVARCTLRKKERTFRIDRIKELTITSEIFTPPKRRASEKRLFSEMKERRGAETAVVRFEKEAVPFIENVASVVGRKSFADGSAEFTFRVVDRKWLCLWVLGWLDSAEILKPKSLRDEFAVLVEEML